MSYRILVTESMAEDGPDWLRANGYEVRYGRGTDPKTLIEDLRDCDGVIPRLAGMSDEVIAASPRLKVIARHGAGVDNVDLESCKRHGVRVVNTAGSNAVAVAEHAVMLMLCCSRSLNSLLRGYEAGRFAECRKTNKAVEISGKTLGLLGFGHVGRNTAGMAHQGFGMAVLVYDPYIDEAKCPDYVTVLRDRDELFRRADFISIHLPVTAETRYSVGAREFQLMKREAFLINTARGPIVDTEALVAALKSGGIAGAALDATEPEPTEPDSPLFGMDNVILTPHVAGSTVEAKAKSSLGAAMGCDEILTGKPPSHLIV